MKIKIGKKKLKVNQIDGFINRFKCMKFVLEPIKEGYCYSKRKWLSTYFFCQKVDIIMTDKENKILYMFPHLKTEKKIFPKRNVYYTYILPLESCSQFTIGDILSIEQKKNI